MKKHIFIASAIALLAAGCNQQTSQQNNKTNQSIVVTSPKAGDKWEVGSTHQVSWTRSKPGAVLQIDLYSTGVSGQKYIYTLVRAAPKEINGQAKVDWKIASDIMSGEYIIKVYEPIQCALNDSSCNVQEGLSGKFDIVSAGSNSGSSENQVYENEYMKVTIPSGWTAKQANKTVYYGNCVNKENCTQTPKVEPNPVAVNITKDNYILYINTQTGQASGIQGGRFAEIAMGAPSADAVVTEQPSPPCGTSQTSAATLDHPRVDLYVSNKEDLQAHPWCHVPSKNSTVWYFSYITDSKGGYFNYYIQNDNGPVGYVITMAYNSKDVNKLPIKDSAELNKMLDEMTSIVKSLEIKQK